MSVFHHESTGEKMVVQASPIWEVEKVAPLDVVYDTLAWYVEGSMPQERRRELGHAILLGLEQRPQEPPHLVELNVAKSPQ